LRIGIVLLLALAVQGCAVARVDPANMAPRNDEHLGLPVDATLLVFIPHSENYEQVVIYNGYRPATYFESGADMVKASVAVSEKYFGDTSEFSSEKETHYVLKILGDAEMNLQWGSYNVKIDAALYSASGELVHEATLSHSVLSGVADDENAFFNSYA